MSYFTLMVTIAQQLTQSSLRDFDMLNKRHIPEKLWIVLDALLKSCLNF